MTVDALANMSYRQLEESGNEDLNRFADPIIISIEEMLDEYEAQGKTTKPPVVKTPSPKNREIPRQDSGVTSHEAGTGGTLEVAGVRKVQKKKPGGSSLYKMVCETARVCEGPMIKAAYEKAVQQLETEFGVTNMNVYQKKMCEVGRQCLVKEVARKTIGILKYRESKQKQKDRMAISKSKV